MKKTGYTFFAMIFAMLLLLAACREGGNTEQAVGDTTQDSLDVMAAPVDSLARELDQTVEDIEKQTSELKSALDSL